MTMKTTAKLTTQQFSVTLMDATAIDETDRNRAEQTYCAAITAEVPSFDLLTQIIADDIAGAKAGLDHFESQRSAWAELDRIGCRAVRAELGYWPGEAAHFEIDNPN